MASLSHRYRQGEHVAVWHQLDTLPPGQDEDDVEDVMRQTFGRVTDNVDVLIDRLRATGYRFESETGRYGIAQAPHRRISVHLGHVEEALEDRFGDLPAFAHGATFLPKALHIFALVVGVVDLRQRYPAIPARPKITEPDIKALPPVARALARAMEGFVTSRDPEKLALQAAIEAEDRQPHPSDDPVIARLGDWNPLVVDLEALQDAAQEREAEMTPLPMGGIGLHVEIAPSFEHKANVSGGEGAHLYLPSLRLNPMIFEDGRTASFMAYLRTAFAQGGFLGVPSPVHLPAPQTKATANGLLLPDHPIFADLAKTLVAF